MSIIKSKQKQSTASYADLKYKNQSLNDSINDAHRIQEAILPKPSHINRIWKNTFVFYKPKDIVSGDFYWVTQKGNSIFWVVADCSGHGIPGAMLTMLGNSFLNYIILGKELIETDEILNAMDEKMHETFRYSDNSEQIDISIVRLNKNNNTISYSGARRKLIHIRNSETCIIAGDKFPIGGLFLEPDRSYTKHKVKIESGDCIYIGSDGFQDQFGGEKGKKYSSRKLHLLLEGISSYDINLQKVQMRLEFTNWKKNNDQVDDVCIMGIKF